MNPTEQISLATYLHQIDPFAIQAIGIRWYGLAYLGGALLGYWIVRWMANRGRTLLPPKLVLDFVTYILFGAFIGGRLGYCLIYKPELFLSFRWVTFGGINIPLWGVIALQDGGMASHGGIIGMIIAAWMFARWQRLPLLHLLDLASFAGPLGVVLGRLANFVNGELYGRPCSPDLSWGVKFPQEILTWKEKQLMTLGPAAKDLGIEPGEWISWLRNASEYQSSITSALNEMITHVQERDPRMIAALEPVLTPRYPSQLIQALLEGGLVFVILAIIWAWPRKPGIVAGWFVILYALARFLGEQFRMPDVEIGFELFGLTRGQELSIVMLLGGILLTVICALRNVPKLPAWIGPALPRPEDSPPTR